jgi:hypothetical protein
LQAAFAYARRPDIHIWLNRFPPPYTEGFEDLIQDPYKLNDEVRGRREEFDRYLSLGEKLHCREPERCKYCYLQSLCDTLDTVIDTRKAQHVDRLRFAGTPPLAGKLPQARWALVAGKNLEEAAALVRAALPADLELELEDYAGLFDALSADGELFGKRLTRCYTDSPADIQSLLSVPGAFEVCAYLTRHTEPVIRALGQPPSRLVLAQKNYDLVSEAHANDIDVKAFFASYPYEVPVENIPACLIGRAPRPHPRTLDVAMLGPDARIDMHAYTKRYVADGFYTKALRCGECAENATCRGVHVNWVRAHGFAPLSPIRTADPDPRA